MAELEHMFKSCFSMILVSISTFYHKTGFIILFLCRFQQKNGSLGPSHKNLINLKNIANQGTSVYLTLKA
jgi:hypothetical protein